MGRPKIEKTVAKEKAKQIEKYGCDLEEIMKNNRPKSSLIRSMKYADPNFALTKPIKDQIERYEKWIKACKEKIKEIENKANEEKKEKLIEYLRTSQLTQEEAIEVVNSAFKKKEKKE
ncbi:MAG: hypothetical protein H6Q15_2282 [Bacteroidetes bacterium]|nr:hypothetical protein [Bacteroidota bacterium]